MSKIKLKSLLEGFAWERKADGSLPTLADTTAAYARKMQEEKAKKSDKPRWQDSDGDGKWYETGEDVAENINELSDEEWDAKHNKPHMMWQRNFVTADQQLNKKYGNASNTGAKPTPEVNRFYQEKLAGLEAERQQLMFDMEQEAEPEGGPIADYYGEQLQNLDDRIEKVRSKMFK